MINTYFDHDIHFDYLYPDHIQQLSSVHWTPIDVARKASEFLSCPGHKVMDIGCGVGKFCLTSAFFHPDTRFYGIDQRPSLIKHANDTKKRLHLSNVDFISGNITDIDFREYRSLYFFNSFYENLNTLAGIDSTVNRNCDLYRFYTQLLYRKLDEQPSGCRLVTYYTKPAQIPPSFKIAEEFYHPELKMYKKD
ncbi:methyltransferase domain-containing protein [Pedobacter fastidiosus]|uniref:Methyltransferase domain-containing protein n=1 Tax=Pedobacter fastidiosus TaxID=2765361 RepID=A0ABR7KS55_9SPHI|nr:class I SAM-dependent methyltransferase [Pedobacter fastidiosus]MBC6110922.1 methyltransferase domain-containing protein [Pedobacter fastidiosus]